jgi:5-methylthioadenosine/S-adenosylhomocysteine deaminase
MSLLIRGVAILPGEGPFIPEGFILIDGDRIRALGPGTGLAADEVRDAAGMVAIPGLVNVHTHLALSTFRGLADDVRLFAFLAETRKRWGTATMEETFAAARAGCREALHSGTTCLYDSHAISPQPVAMAGRDVGMRVVGAGSARSTWFGAPARDTFADVLRETEATAARYARRDLMYVPSLAAHSPYHCTAEQIQRVKTVCRERGWVFAIHLAECEEEVQLIRQWTGKTPAAYLDSLGVLDERTLLAHAVFLDVDDIGRLAHRGSHIAHCPKSNAKLGDGVAPVPECLRAGVSIALGTDSMVSNNTLDMLEEMRFGALIHRGVHRDPTVITARTMFEMATLAGARAVGLDREIGSLRPGKKADLVLLALAPPLARTEESVLSELVFHATSRDVRTVIVNGRIVLDEGECLDAPAATRRAPEAE